MIGRWAAEGEGGASWDWSDDEKSDRTSGRKSDHDPANYDGGQSAVHGCLSVVVIPFVVFQEVSPVDFHKPLHFRDVAESDNQA